MCKLFEFLHWLCIELLNEVIKEVRTLRYKLIYSLWNKIKSCLFTVNTHRMKLSLPLKPCFYVKFLGVFNVFTVHWENIFWRRTCIMTYNLISSTEHRFVSVLFAKRQVVCLVQYGGLYEQKIRRIMGEPGEGRKRLLWFDQQVCTDNFTVEHLPTKI